MRARHAQTQPSLLSFDPLAFGCVAEQVICTHRQKQVALCPDFCNRNDSFLAKHTTAQSNLSNLLLWLRFFFSHTRISTHSTRTKIQTPTTISEFFPCMMLLTVRILKCEEEEKDSLNCSTYIFQKALLGPYGQFYCQNLNDYMN